MKILLIVFGLAFLTSGLHAQEEAALETAVKKTATTELQAIESRLAAIAGNIDTLKENTRFYSASAVYNLETGGQGYRIQVKLLLGCPEPQLPPTIPRPPPSDNCAFTADAIGITVTGLAEQKLGDRAVLME